jgi:hypothetical protein
LAVDADEGVVFLISAEADVAAADLRVLVADRPS